MQSSKSHYFIRFWADFLKSLDVAQRVVSIETLMEVSLCTYCVLSPPGSPGCWFPGALAARGRQLLCKLSSETIAWNQAPGNKLQISVPPTANCSEIFFFLILYLCCLSSVQLGRTGHLCFSYEF